jgi:hypothetical protein
VWPLGVGCCRVVPAAFYSQAGNCYAAFAAAFPDDRRAAKALANVKEFSEGLGADANANACLGGLDLSAIAGKRRGRDHQPSGRSPD